MKRFFVTLLCVAMGGVSLYAQQIVKGSEVKLKSPDKSYEFKFYQRESGAGERTNHFSVEFEGQEIVSESRLALDMKSSDFDMSRLSVINTRRESVDSEWQPVYGERATIEDCYNEVTISLRSETDGVLDDLNIIVRAYEEGVAFRYQFPESSEGREIRIADEPTTFTMSEGTLASYSTWAQGPYEMRTLEGWTEECERPVVMQLPEGLTVAVGEAAMVDYARGKFNLDESKSNTLVTKLSSDVIFTAPYATPWRLVMAGERAVDLINNNDLYLNLNEPCKIEDTSWIKPGKVFRTGLTQDDAMSGVDFAAARGLQYVHFDAGWYGPERDPKSDARREFPERDLNLKKICEYADSKGVGVLVYVNKIALYSSLDEILPIYKEWGIKGLKFGFVDVGSQKVTKWMHEAIAKCAKYEMMVDVHDEYRPTGFSRTYPNLMTQEGIRGNEEMPDAFNNVMLSFTRFLPGAGDYTLCYFSNRIQTTRAHQLAMAAVYYSPLQFMFWYDSPRFYRGEQELEYWAKAPAVWDDSRALDGEIGEYITMARRTGDDWFVGSLTNQARTITIDTEEFLEKGKEYELSIYRDNLELKSRTNVEIIRRKVTRGEVLTFDLLKSGGVALHFEMCE